MDLKKLYDYRFRNIDSHSRHLVWREIATFLSKVTNEPTRVLDPACGTGEFISQVKASERWAADLYSNIELPKDIRFKCGTYQSLELPSNYFDLILLSNFLEHLKTPEEIQDILLLAQSQLRSDGTVAILGPNFKFTIKKYFDFADHRLPLTHETIKEHCAAAGLNVVKCWPKFLPYSFTSRLPASRILTRLYLRIPLLWRVLGKQFLILAQPGS